MTHKPPPPPLLVAVLPKPRRSRHPYQWCICLGLLLLSASQLSVGPPPSSSTAGLSLTMMIWLNTQTVLSCALCLLAAVVRDGWLRLGVELAGQVMAASVFGFYGFVIWQKVGFTQGLTLGLVLAIAIGAAAALRAVQILATIRDYHHAILLSAEQAERGER